MRLPTSVLRTVTMSERRHDALVFRQRLQADPTTLACAELTSALFASKSAAFSSATARHVILRQQRLIAFVRDLRQSCSRFGIVEFGLRLKQLLIEVRRVDLGNRSPAFTCVPMSAFRFAT